MLTARTTFSRKRAIILLPRPSRKGIPALRESAGWMVTCGGRRGAERERTNQRAGVRVALDRRVPPLTSILSPPSGARKKKQAAALTQFLRFRVPMVRQARTSLAVFVGEMQRTALMISKRTFLRGNLMTEASSRLAEADSFL
jgi:hypothetical protein